MAYPRLAPAVAPVMTMVFPVMSALWRLAAILDIRIGFWLIQSLLPFPTVPSFGLVSINSQFDNCGIVRTKKGRPLFVVAFIAPLH